MDGKQGDGMHVPRPRIMPTCCCSAALAGIALNLPERCWLCQS
jgi:hypothetical protein